MGNVSKRQQPGHRADNSRRPPMGLQCSNSFELISHHVILKLRMEMGCVSKRQQHGQRAENSPMTLMGLQHSKKIVPDPEDFIVFYTVQVWLIFEGCIVACTCIFYIMWSLVDSGLLSSRATSSYFYTCHWTLNNKQSVSLLFHKKTGSEIMYFSSNLFEL